MSATWVQFGLLAAALPLQLLLIPLNARKGWFTPGELGMRLEQSPLRLMPRRRDGRDHCGMQRVDAGAGPLRPGCLGDPGRMLEHRPQRGHEIGLCHAVQGADGERVVHHAFLR